ncbi:MAG: polyprenyl synthetase family protein [Planctomycetes bacterium]|nr:polyprenyl synthetase family protein [Planctomycetota bacterium]
MSIPGNTLETDLVSLRDRVNQQLAEYVSPGAFTSAADCPSRLRESMAYSLLAGGKRLRPLLVLLTSEACGGRVEAALPAACAIEMVHTYSLIHDDLPAMDDDDLRRGRPTNHKVYGEAMAILAGDALLTLAFEVVAQFTPRPDVAAACCVDLASASGWCGMVAGQVADLEAEAAGVSEKNSPDKALSQLEAIHRRKTGRLLTSAVTLGARVALATPELMKRLEQFGKCVGLAFQIADDLLDVTGDAAKLGKKVGKDASLGKMTYPGLLGVEASRQKADALIDEACQMLQPLGEQGDKLAALAKFMTRRDH